MNAPTTPDPIEMAMAAEATGAAPEGIAHEVLRRQSALLGWQVAGARAAFALRILGVAAAAGAAVLVGLMLWRASQARGLVIEAFDVPPALAERGLTGKVLATQVQDRLDRMQAETVTPDAALTVSNRWSGDIAVEIPSTGVSLGEIDRLLRQWLGREVHVTGEAYAVTRPDGTPGLALTVRTSSGAGAPAAGTEAGLDTLIQAAAETIQRQTQPTAYADWLGQHGREAEAISVYRWITSHGTPEERGAAWLRLFRADPAPPWVKSDLLDRAFAADPSSPQITNALAGRAFGEGHPEQGMAYSLKAERLARRSKRMSPAGVGLLVAAGRSDREWFMGDYLASLASAEVQRRYDVDVAAASNRLADATILAQNHDVAGSRQVVAETPPPPPGSSVEGARRGYQYRLGLTQARQFEALGAWPELVAFTASVEAQARATGQIESILRNTEYVTLKAVALARVGRHQEAAAAIATTRPDHYAGVVTRGEVAGLAGDTRVSDHWFAEADKLAPSFPQAPERWGRMLLARGQVDAAIAKAKLASKRSPRFGDALELWGEALLAKGDAKGAAAKFGEAVKFSPRWGRLQIKWGQALAKQGKTAEAQTKWREAAGMDLTAPERAELATMMR